MPDPPRRLALVHGDSRHEAALGETTEARADPDAQYGLPLLRARSAFISPALWKAALVASHVRSNPGYSDTVPGTPWRYEVFVVPSAAPRDTWSSWDRQQASPELRAEAERQNTFLAASIELGRRLLACELQGWGRLGSMVGPWTEIPFEAWYILRVPFEAGFRGWQRGHLNGPGMEFWGVRILDRVGLPLRAAALAYGPADVVAVAQRGMTCGHRKPLPPPRPGSLAAGMASVAMPQIGPAMKPGAAELSEAVRSLRQGVVRQLRDGALIADGEGAAGQRRSIEARLWATGRADFGVSALESGPLRFIAIRIRRPSQLPNEANDGEIVAIRRRVKPRILSQAEVAEWFKRRVQQYSGEARHPTEADDEAAAAAEFSRKVPRDWVRHLRATHVPADRRPQGRVKR